jgi:hypothetical protein
MRNDAGSGTPAVACACLAVLLGCSAATAQTLADSPVVFRSSDWAVHRRQDPMTDANICTALYRGHSGIQLGSHSLAIAIDGGVKSVTLRYDNAAAHAPRPPKHSERSVAAVNIEGAEFDELLQSGRLRYRVLTETDNVVEGVIVRAGARDAFRNIQNGCLGEPLSPGS